MSYDLQITMSECKHMSYQISQYNLFMFVIFKHGTHCYIHFAVNNNYSIHILHVESLNIWDSQFKFGQTFQIFLFAVSCE